MHFIYKESFFLSAGLAEMNSRQVGLARVGIVVQKGQCVLSQSGNLDFGPLSQLPLVEMGNNWIADCSSDPTPETEQKASSLGGQRGFGLMIVAVARTSLEGCFTWRLGGGWAGAVGPSSSCLPPNGSGNVGSSLRCALWEANLWSKVTFVYLKQGLAHF